MNRGVQHRLAITFGLFAVTIFSVGGFLFYEQTRRAMEEELGAKLLAVGSIVAADVSEQQRLILAASGIGSRTSRALSTRLAEVRAATGLHQLYVFDANGTALADAELREPSYTYPELEFEREALRGVFTGSPIVGHLFTGIEGNIYKSAYVPLGAGEQVPAALAVVGSATFLDSISRMRKAIIAVSAVGIVASILLSVLMARTIVNPIRRLVSSADRIREGDLETSVPDVGQDEVGYLGQTLERMREAVLARERSLRAMLGGVAHEIRNPLGGIELFAGLLKRKTSGDVQATEQVDRILHEVRHLDGIIKDFLEYARPSDPDRQAVSVADTMREIEAVLHTELTARKATLDHACGEVVVHADPSQFRQVLINLVLNAVQAQREGGWVRVTAEENGSRATVRIEDGGPGIPEEVRERVLEPFFTTRQQGSGLGLTIASGLVTRNGGTMKILDGAEGGAIIHTEWDSGGTS